MSWVVKLGGSLYSHSALSKLLEHTQSLFGSSTGCTIVPGGGPFADQVRDAYHRWHLREASAHKMAILGMRLYGRLLADLSGLPICYSESCNEQRCVIWLPSDDPLPACLTEIPSYRLDWNFTSDSISLCLANYIGARYLVLLKAVPVERETSFEKLVDQSFKMLMQDIKVKIVCLSAEQCLALNSVDECTRYRVDSLRT